MSTSPSTWPRSLHSMSRRCLSRIRHFSVEVSSRKNWESWMSSFKSNLKSSKPHLLALEQKSCWMFLKRLAKKLKELVGILTKSISMLRIIRCWSRSITSLSWSWIWSASIRLLYSRLWSTSTRFAARCSWFQWKEAYQYSSLRNWLKTSSPSHSVSMMVCFL